MAASLNILVVDDDERSLAAVRRTLSNVPAEVVGVTSGEDALSLVETREFALAILDVEMAGMDGYELAERLRRTPDAEGLPIIFLSGSHGEDQHVFRGYESGAVDYLLKPFDPGVLTSKVNVFLELARKRLELAEYGLRLERMVEDRRGQGAFRSGGRGGADAEQLRHDLLAVLWPRHRGAEGTLTLVWHR